MTEAEINAAIEKIKAKYKQGDHEAAHALEDGLLVEFVEFMAKRKDKIGKLARLVLTTEAIPFYRWTA